MKEALAKLFAGSGETVGTEDASIVLGAGGKVSGVGRDASQTRGLRCWVLGLDNVVLHEGRAGSFSPRMIDGKRTGIGLGDEAGVPGDVRGNFGGSNAVL